MTTPTPPGWYPDPSGGPGTQYWDGSQWTATAPQPAAKKRRVWPWILLAVVLLFLGGCGAFIVVVASSVGGDHHNDSQHGDAAAVGQEVRDGKFAFVVKGVKTLSQLGATRARGQFVVVTMTVTNTGNEPQSFFVENQKLVDTNNRQYAADSIAAISINNNNGNNNSMIINMNPGFTITADVPFDVPPGITYSLVELHDSAFSDGAKVKL